MHTPHPHHTTNLTHGLGSRELATIFSLASSLAHVSSPGAPPFVRSFLLSSFPSSFSRSGTYKKAFAVAVAVAVEGRGGARPASAAALAPISSRLSRASWPETVKMHKAAVKSIPNAA